MSFWAERLRNGLLYVGVSIAFMVGIYALFLKPTNNTSNKTAKGDVVSYWAGAKQTTFGCAYFSSKEKPLNKGKE